MNWTAIFAIATAALWWAILGVEMWNGHGLSWPMVLAACASTASALMTTAWGTP